MSDEEDEVENLDVPQDLVMPAPPQASPQKPVKWTLEEIMGAVQQGALDRARAYRLKQERGVEVREDERVLIDQMFEGARLLDYACQFRDEFRSLCLKVKSLPRWNW